MGVGGAARGEGGGGLGRARVLTAVALAALTAWLFAWGVREFAFLSDDAFISYRYSRNFAEGLGLVWNEGEPPVEGYTSFALLWLGVLAFRVGLEPEAVAVSVTVAAGAGILFLCWLFGARRRGFGNPMTLLVPLCLAANRTFVAWSTGGLATQLFSFSVLAAALVFLHERRRATRFPLASSLLFAWATLVRPEGAIFTFAAGLVFLHEVALLRRRRLTALVLWCAPWFAVVLAHLAWRHATYGELLPNTYFAKVSGRVRVAEGWQFVRWFAFEYGLAPFLPLLLVPAFLRRRAEDFLFLLFLLLYGGYVTWVGGDWMEFRFVNPALPYLYLVLVEGLAVFAGLMTGSGPVARLLHQRMGTADLVPPAWLPGVGSLFKALAGVAFLLLFVVTARTSLRTDAETPARGHLSDVREQMRVYSHARAEQGKALRHWVQRGLLPADLHIAVKGAGALPYYSRLRTTDVLGWNDPHVREWPIVDPGRTGHERNAPESYLRERGVEVIDLANQLVFHSLVPDAPRTAELPYYAGRVVAYEVEPGVYLAFGTFLDDAQLAARFPRLARVL